MTNLIPKILLLALLALSVSGAAHAFDNTHSSHSYASKKVSWKKSSYGSSNYAQAKVRSRSEVMNEVKQRYNAKVLKISLNEKAGVYYVRMLMPSGKVRSIQVNAR